MSGSVLFSNNTCTLGNGGAISLAPSSHMIVSDNVTFEYNTATNGGAMSIRFATLIMKEHSIMFTNKNTATVYGGAIFHQDDPGSFQCNFKLNEDHTMEDLLIMLPDCFLVLENFKFNYERNISLYQIRSNHDSAHISGHFIYGGLMDKCRVFDTNNSSIMSDLLYNVVMKYSILHIETNETNAISSEAYKLCFCENNKEHDCRRFKSISVSKGGNFSVSLIAFSQGNNTITATRLLANLNPSVRILPSQVSVLLPPKCTTLSYNMYSTEQVDELEIHTNGSCQTFFSATWVEVIVTFLPCPCGFVESGDKCDCEKRLLDHDVVCGLSNDKFYLKKKASDFQFVSMMEWMHMHILGSNLCFLPIFGF